MGRPMAASLVVQPGYLRKGDAAKYLGISIRTLSDWERKRVVPFFKMSHRMVLFKRSDLDDAMNRFRAAAIGE